MGVVLCVVMDSGSQQEIRIIDKDESSDQAFHVVEGFVIEDSKTLYPVRQKTINSSNLYSKLFPFFPLSSFRMGACHLFLRTMASLHLPLHLLHLQLMYPHTQRNIKV